MGRLRKNELEPIMPENALELPVEKIALAPAQAETLRRSEERIAAAAAMLLRVEREIKTLKMKINESQEARELKKLKAKRKMLMSIHQDAASAYNGALEMALAEVPGHTLSEKIRNYLNEKK